MPPVLEKKGLPVIAWVGIGCGGFIVLGIIVSVIAFVQLKGVYDKFVANPEKAGAEMIVSMNPDLKMLSQDEAKGTMTIRTKDGQEMTLSYKDISEGKFTLTDANGNTTTLGSTDLSKVPAWVPKAADLTDGMSLFHTDGNGKISGQFSSKSVTSEEDLKTFFDKAADDQGLTNKSNSSINADGTSVVTLTYSGGSKTLKILITDKSGSPAIIITQYTEE